MSSVIQWPRGAKAQETSDAFGEISGFLNVLGAVDGSHIPITAPKENPNAYYNRKKFHSVVLLATCDANLQFTYVWTGKPGSTHDASVLRSSELFVKSDDLFPPGFYLLGDSAFPLLGWLVTPFRDFGNLTRGQRLFNVCHSKARQVIERSFGLLKVRFRRLLRFDACDMNLIVKSNLSACVLHNICIKMNEENFDLFDDDNTDNHACDNAESRPSGYQMNGVRLRNGIMQHLVQLN
nr:putative nuclease HARBI1 [Crassostrea gigas]